MFRCANADNYLFFTAGATNFSFGKRVAGGYSAILPDVPTTPIANGTPYTLSVDCVGDNIVCKFNGTTVFTATVTDHNYATAFGMELTAGGLEVTSLEVLPL